MKPTNLLTLLTSSLLLAGCGSTLPTCGTPEAAAYFKANPSGSCTAPWWSVLQGVPPSSRNYVNEPFKPLTPLPPVTPAPTPAPANSGTQTILVNTPNGVVQCFVTNGLVRCPI